MTERPTGLARASGWQAGARRTLPIEPLKAWEVLLSPPALRAWLGAVPAVPLESGAEFTLPDGACCKITVFKPGSHMRMQWQPRGYTHPAILQVRVMPAGEKTVFAFHQENLPDEAARRECIAFYQNALDLLEKL